MNFIALSVPAHAIALWLALRMRILASS